MNRCAVATGRALAATTLVVLAACRRPDSATIGYSVGAFGTNAVRVARDEIDSTRRPGDPAITIRFDSLASSDAPEVAIPEARHFVRVPDLVAVVGPGGSRIALAVAPVYNDARVPHIPPTATSRLIARAGPWTFPLAPDDSVEGAFIARFVTDSLRAGRVQLFYQNDEYGEGLESGVVAALAARGAAPLYDAPVDATTDFDAAAGAALVHGRPDVVICAARSEETAGIARAFRRRGVAVAVVAGDGALTARLGPLAGPTADSLYVASFWTPAAGDPASRAFVARFRRVLGRTPNGPEALNHDAIMLIVAAVREVGPDRAAIRRWLLSLGRTRPAWPGVTGPVAFGVPEPGRLIMLRLRRDAGGP